jgi:hypothetical protein
MSCLRSVCYSCALHDTPPGLVVSASYGPPARHDFEIVYLFAALWYAAAAPQISQNKFLTRLFTPCPIFAMEIGSKSVTKVLHSVRCLATGSCNL